MKMSGKQFKSLIKECLKELIQEGHFQQMMMESMNHQGMVSPNMGGSVPSHVQNSPMGNAVSTLVSDMSKGNSGAASALYEIFADTAANHPHVLGDRHAQHMGMLNRGFQQSEQENRQASGMLQEHHQTPQSQITNPAPASQQGQYVSRWAELAFSKSQRPR